MPRHLRPINADSHHINTPSLRPGPTIAGWRAGALFPEFGEDQLDAVPLPWDVGFDAFHVFTATW
ncbi:hypothetical protein CCMA1212_002652 [Trichoderma ghanense]|uniref:Uncharacterized protein n=1 Tax=Trichoderma ghanense TaxID=65468 RepID=A0ABY2HBF0_9HYPO